MKGGRTRLFVIVDPTARHQIALVKALLIAKLADCEIHAFMCVHGDTRDSSANASRREFKHSMLLDAETRLHDWLEPCRIAGIPLSKEVVWNSEWYDAALHAIVKSNCDLVIKSSFHHSRARRFFSPTSDYTLMRNCSCPILFTHQAEEWQSGRLLACVDLVSTDRQHLRLNEVVIRNARALAQIVAMDLYIAAAHEDEIDADKLPLDGRGHDVSVDRLAQFYQVEESRIILRQGETIETLANICDEIEPSIVILGTLARSGISGKLVGNTAEKLLDRIDADLLSVN